jgi:hypothetical protein
VLLANPRWERRFVKFLELSGVGRVIVDGYRNDVKCSIDDPTAIYLAKAHRAAHKDKQSLKPDRSATGPTPVPQQTGRTRMELMSREW